MPTGHNIVRDLPVLRVEGERVICGGRHPTADGKGSHDLLQPVIHRHEIETAVEIRPGDRIVTHDDGSHAHHPMQRADS